ncbi:MAG: pantoate--beta-alanine ligase [Marinirhabdus sp.]
MNVFTHPPHLRQYLSKIRAANKTIGFVPTMGALHEGHRALVDRAEADTDVVVMSIFVNPTQFNNTADLERYPRNVQADIAFIGAKKNNIVVFAPHVKTIYGSNVVPKDYDFGSLSQTMEGKHRPGHFNGVGTIVSILLKTVVPDRAYFGEKDFQQLQIVKKLVRSERLPVTIVGVPTVRETNGLALSSRNQRLSAEQRREAAFIFKTLKEVKLKFRAKSIPKLHRYVAAAFKDHPFLRLEYFEIANEKTLKTAHRKHKKTPYRAFIVAHAGNVRLIDNLAL